MLLRRSENAAVLLAAVVALTGASLVVPLVTMAEYDRPPRAATARPVAASQLHASDVRALRWLRDHSDSDDLAATNRHCRGVVKPECDRRAFDFSAYSERRILVEGWGYTPLADAQYDPETGSRWKEFWDADLIAANDRFFEHPDAAGRDALVAHGVRWLILDRRIPDAAPTLEPWATLRRSSRNLTVYDLDPT